MVDVPVLIGMFLRGAVLLFIPYRIHNSFLDIHVPSMDLNYSFFGYNKNRTMDMRFLLPVFDSTYPYFEFLDIHVSFMDIHCSVLDITKSKTQITDIQNMQYS